MSAKRKGNKPGRLTDHNVPRLQGSLTTRNDGLFRVAFAGEATEKGYRFEDCSQEDWHRLGKWLNDWVGKKIQALASYKDGRGTDRKQKSLDPYSDKLKTEQHYSFGGGRRVHGYYNQQGYFTITKIDPDHKVHKRK